MLRVPLGEIPLFHGFPECVGSTWHLESSSWSRQGAKPGIAAHSQYEMPVGHLERVGRALLELDDFSSP